MKRKLRQIFVQLLRNPEKHICILCGSKCHYSTKLTICYNQECQGSWLPG